MLKRLLPVLFLFLLTSCANQAQQSQYIHNTLQNRDQMIKEAHVNDGFKMSFAMVEVAPGVRALLPQEISYKEQAKFEQNLPTAPEEHPAWKAVERIGVAAIQGTVKGCGMNSASDVLQSGIAASKSSVHTVGPVDNSAYSSINTNIDTSRTDNSIVDIDASRTDNSIGPVDNTDNSIGPVDNSATQPTQ